VVAIKPAEYFPIHPGLVIEALEIRPAGQLDQVAVALLAHREEGDVVPDVIAASRTIEPGTWGQVGLHPDHGGDAGGGCLLVEVDGAVQDSVVGETHARLAIRHHRLHHIGDPGRPIEHRIFSVQMQMGETASRHRCSSENYRRVRRG
jgi:hypothetical protein